MEFIQNIVNWLFAPQYLVTLMIIGLVLFLKYRVVCTQNKVVAYSILAFPVVFFAIAAMEENFWIQFKRADNLPIALLMFLIVFFVWFAMKKAVDNDLRIADGKPPHEAEPEEEEKVFVWPDLVYTEFICVLLVSIFLVVWSIAIPAPLEEPANPQLTPNPSKAPWYFLGLQEILVYFDPWLAGVVIPTLIIVGLVAIPYIDTNTKGNGYYTFAERRSEIFLFLFGFLILWISLVFQGTFLRGPNWNFYGPFEVWDTHKVLALNNVQLSEYIWARMLGVGLPSNWFIREIFGIVFVLAYFTVLPLFLTKKYFQYYLEKMGPVRYGVGIFLFMFLILVPIKMYLRWTVNLKYFVSIPEFFFNI